MRQNDDLWWVEQVGGYTPHEKALTIRDIKRRITMERVLKHYGGTVPVERNGTDWSAVKCPFHPDANASASFNPALNRFRCHGCDVGGDIFDVVAAAEGLHGTKEAMAWIVRNLL